MPRGGKRQGAGRKQGTANNRTREIANKVSTSGVTPLEYMINVMRDPTQDHSRRDDMAKAAAPYVHSKMPTALVMPQPPSKGLNEDDETIFETYLRGLHAEADED